MTAYSAHISVNSTTTLVILRSRNNRATTDYHVTLCLILSESEHVELYIKQ